MKPKVVAPLGALGAITGTSRRMKMGSRTDLTMTRNSGWRSALPFSTPVWVRTGTTRCECAQSRVAGSARGPSNLAVNGQSERKQGAHGKRASLRASGRVSDQASLAPGGIPFRGSHHLV